MTMQDYIIKNRGQSPFIDVQLPQHLTRRFERRALSTIGAMSIHQTAATSSFPNIARYHSSPDNHLCKKGCPGICYHFVIDYDGTVYQVNDLTSIVYSSGKKKHYRLPSQANCFDRWGKYFNKYSISVMLRGAFDGPGYKGGQEPTAQQIIGLARLVLWATTEARFADNSPLELCNILGHCHVNKNACPGFVVQDWIENTVWTGKIHETSEEVVENSETDFNGLNILEQLLGKNLGGILGRGAKMMSPMMRHDPPVTGDIPCEYGLMRAAQPPDPMEELKNIIRRRLE